jgi:pyruvate-formate lyase-activating enzyme
MPHYSKAKILQMEISSNCNLNCLGCVRTDRFSYSMKGHPGITKNIFMTIDKFTEIFDSPAAQEVEEVQFCGSIDDPLMHNDFIEMCEILADKKIFTVIHTNASLRTPAYFADLAKKLYGRIKFNVDGLEETNHLYRRGSNFKKIVENAKAFIDAGGDAHWQYLEFPWNEHQTQDAKALATKMGFRKFVYRRDRSGTPLPGKFDDMIKIEKKKSLQTWEEYKEKYPADNTIECFSQNEKMYFIGHDCRVWPCCFLHNSTWLSSGNYEETEKRYIDNYGENWNSLYHHTFEDIVNHRFYAEDLVDSWSSTEHGTGSKDRIIRCTQTCQKKDRCSRPIGNFKADELQ